MGEPRMIADIASGEAMAAVSCVALTYVVGRSSPSKLTTESAVNPVPVTVRVNGAAPTAAVFGLILATVESGAHNEGG